MTASSPSTPAPAGREPYSPSVVTMASWIRWGIARGLLRPLEVHGFADGPRPSRRSLTMSPELIAALAAPTEETQP